MRSQLTVNSFKTKYIIIVLNVWRSFHKSNTFLGPLDRIYDNVTNV